MIVTTQQYRDRIEAGHVLAQHLAAYASRVDTLVLALPRGGVPIGVEVASYLNAPLDAFLVRKLGLPDHPEIAMGAVASGGVRVLDHELIAQMGVTSEQVAEITAREKAELQRREKLYRGTASIPRITDRVVIVVDDGLATGFSMHAAVIALHRQQPAWLVVASPVGSVEACEELAQEVHELVCPLRPEPFHAVGLWYDHFAPVDDDEVRAALRKRHSLPAP